MCVSVSVTVCVCVAVCVRVYSVCVCCVYRRFSSATLSGFSGGGPGSTRLDTAWPGLVCPLPWPITVAISASGVVLVLGLWLRLWSVLSALFITLERPFIRVYNASLTSLFSSLLSSAVPSTISTHNTLSLSQRLGLVLERAKGAKRRRRRRRGQDVHIVAAHTAGGWSSDQDHTIPTKYDSLRCMQNHTR